MGLILDDKSEFQTHQGSSEAMAVLCGGANRSSSSSVRGYILGKQIESQKLAWELQKNLFDWSISVLGDLSKELW